MLLRFDLAYFGAFREAERSEDSNVLRPGDPKPHRVDFRASAPNDPDPRTRSLRGVEGRVGTVLAAYGVDGAGKSTLLDGVYDLAYAVVKQHLPAWDEVRSGDDEVPSLLAATFAVDGVVYEYALRCEEDVIWERLVVNKEAWLYRTHEGVQLFGPLKGRLRQIHPDETYLSLYGAEVPALAPVMRWFSSVAKFDPDKDEAGYFRDLRLFEEFAALASRLNLGFNGVKLLDDGHPEFHQQLGRGPHRNVPFRFQSGGVRRTLNLLVAVLRTLADGGVLLVDDLNWMHPAILAEVVRMFHDPEENPNDAQLAFTTNATQLLGPRLIETGPVLRPYEVYVVAGGASGSRLTRLADRAEEGDDVEACYLKDDYGGVPRIRD